MGKRRFAAALLAIIPAGLLAGATLRAEPVVIGSKVFTESVILAEIATQLLNHEGVESVHRRELGGTRVLWSALIRGDIDCYPEYTGTLLAEVFRSQVAEDDALAGMLAREGVRSTPPLGFNNTYVLGMRRDRAEALRLQTISQLRSHPKLRIGLSNEFLQRADGWRGLRERYQLPHSDVRGLAHVLAYRAVADGALDVTDLYSTDAEIAHYDLISLQDDAHFFPVYNAVIVCRADAGDRVFEPLAQLADQIDEAAMMRMNAQAKIDRVPEARVAAEFLENSLGKRVDTAVSAGRAERVWRRTQEHLAMVGISLAAAIVVALPLGVLAFYRPAIGRVVLGLADVLQTLPALALLVFLIPWLGIGYAPAIVALLIYSVLPILRNTYAGLADIPREMRESAQALGLAPFAQLIHIEAPLAARSILAGVRTAAVINVGTATLGALIGAGGYGQPILTGIRLDDLGLILEGAIPAAVLALLAQAIFGRIERRWVSAK